MLQYAMKKTFSVLGCGYPQRTY